MPEIRRELDRFAPALDVIVREDRFSNQVSGITSYSGVECILGLLWWKYVGISLRAVDCHMLLGGSLNPQKILLMSRILSYSKSLSLTGEVGLKFWMVKNEKDSVFKTVVT